MDIEEQQVVDVLDNLNDFEADFTLKQATYAFIGAQLLSKAERDNLSKVFKAFDKDGDGKLSKQELQDGYNEHYGRIMSDEEIDKMFAAVDTDHSGFVDFSEFVVAAMQ